MTDARARLLADLASTEAQLRDLQRDHDGVVAASREANADDEHDPEGATIAFERQQLVALLEQARTTRAALLRALTQLEEGGYGVCEACGGAIGADRLEARPGARTCIACARQQR
ncbi:MAG: Zinc finger, DksA/TraR C4-type [Frankiales bacterium]|nr:Zinc finger, DksA/TraR C4-type [Frankiales bacterium]